MFRLERVLADLLAALDQRHRGAGDVPPGVTLDQDQAATVLDALDFAAEYRRYRASLTCQTCATHPAELCEDHAADLDRAEEYDRLAGQIGGVR